MKSLAFVLAWLSRSARRRNLRVVLGLLVVSTLHRAGADAVLSYASLGATEIGNEMGVEDSLVVAEALDVSACPYPPGWPTARLPTPTCARGRAAT